MERKPVRGAGQIRGREYSSKPAVHDSWQGGLGQEVNPAWHPSLGGVYDCGEGQLIRDSATDAEARIVCSKLQTVTQPLPSPYYDLSPGTEDLRRQRPRHEVGGLWQEVGRLQFDFLRGRSLGRGDRVLDAGCGCLRLGVHLVDYLHPGLYYGVDISPALLDAGYDVELERLGLQGKLPRENLLCDGEFRFERFGVVFDLAIAHSLFTHLPLDQVQLCLARLAPVIEVGGVLYATVFLCATDEEWSRSLYHPRGGVTTHPAANPYHYRPADLVACVAELPWTMTVIGEWGHPRDQGMVAFTRIAARR